MINNTKVKITQKMFSNTKVKTTTMHIQNFKSKNHNNTYSMIQKTPMAMNGK